MPIVFIKGVQFFSQTFLTFFTNIFTFYSQTDGKVPNGEVNQRRILNSNVQLLFGLSMR